MAKDPTRPTRATDLRPPRVDKLDATNPAQPENPEHPAAVDYTKRPPNHNQMPRRDPSGARGKHDQRPGQTKHTRTKR